MFAVAITLLALDLGRVHAQTGVGDGSLNAALGRYWPTLLAFAASFAFIGVAWTNHHSVFVRVARVSRGLNAANLLLLAGITMVPWATSTLADALSQRGDHGQQEVLLYAAVLMFGTLTWLLVFHTLATHPELLVDPDDARGFRADRIGTLIGFAATTLAAAIGFLWSPVAATLLFLALPVFFAFASEGFERHDRDAEGPGTT